MDVDFEGRGVILEEGLLLNPGTGRDRRGISRPVLPTKTRDREVITKPRDGTGPARDIPSRPAY